jgi:membrane protein YdbS with pleckstrin-like domain
MRLAPNTDTVPASVNRYLLPHERQVISVHEHPAVLIGPIALVLLGLAIAGFVSNSGITHGNTTAILVIWGLWVVLLAWLGVKIWTWATDYFVVTSERLILAKGVVVRNVGMLPLTKVTDMSFRRSTIGRFLGYGEFIVESAGQDQALRNVKFIPYPEQLYLEVCGLIFKEKDAPKAEPPGPDPVSVQLVQALNQLTRWLDQNERRNRRPRPERDDRDDRRDRDDKRDGDEWRYGDDWGGGDGGGGDDGGD